MCVLPPEHHGSVSGVWRDSGDGPGGARARARGGGNLLDDLSGLEQHMLGDGETEGLGGFEIDDELELTRLLHGQISGRSPLQDTVHEVARTPEQLSRSLWISAT